MAPRRRRRVRRLLARPALPRGDRGLAGLGRKVLRFLARHMDHDLLAASDEGGRADAIIEAGDYRDADGEYDEGAMRADA